VLGGKQTSPSRCHRRYNIKQIDYRNSFDTGRDHIATNAGDKVLQKHRVLKTTEKFVGFTVI
jgi:hypothetical protein